MAEAEPKGEQVNPVERHALAIGLDNKIGELIRFRKWHRTRSAFLRPYFADLERNDRILLRGLLALRREAKRVARAAEVAQSTAVDAGVTSWEIIDNSVRAQRGEYPW